MNNTRSDQVVSAQIGKMGAITGLQDGDFSLEGNMPFNIKNDGVQQVELEVRLAGDKTGTFVSTVFYPGWNPEIVSAVRQTTAAGLNLKWGY